MKLPRKGSKYTHGGMTSWNAGGEMRGMGNIRTRVAE